MNKKLAWVAGVLLLLVLFPFLMGLMVGYARTSGHGWPGGDAPVPDPFPTLSVGDAAHYGFRDSEIGDDTTYITRGRRTYRVAAIHGRRVTVEYTQWTDGCASVDADGTTTDYDLDDGDRAPQTRMLSILFRRDWTPEPLFEIFAPRENVLETYAFHFTRLPTEAVSLPGTTLPGADGGSLRCEGVENRIHFPQPGEGDYTENVRLRLHGEVPVFHMARMEYTIQDGDHRTRVEEWFLAEGPEVPAATGDSPRINAEGGGNNEGDEKSEVDGDDGKSPSSADAAVPAPEATPEPAPSDGGGAAESGTAPPSPETPKKQTAADAAAFDGPLELEDPL